MLIKIITICIASTVIITLLKNVLPSFVPLAALAVSIVSFYIMLPYINNVLNFIVQIENIFGDLHEYIKMAVKISFIALICDFASQICIDSGQRFLASKIIIAGKLIIIGVCSPMILKFITTIGNMVNSI